MYKGCTVQKPARVMGPVSSSDLAPDRGFEPRTLRLTDRCTPFRNAASNSLSAAEYRQLPPFATGVAVRNTVIRFVGFSCDWTDVRRFGGSFSGSY